jgi:LmbE family N-acetylglucosaminyl deacetylase
MIKKILVVVAHPDDEVFGPGGTIAKYASREVEIHIISATRGESGQWHEDSKKKHSTTANQEEIKISHVREKELRNSAKVLGVKQIDFLDFMDGELCNNVYHKIADKIITKINDYKPQVIITMDRLGVSGHLDHIAVSMITTFAFLKTTIPKKLYYEVMFSKHRQAEKRLDDYFIYFPEGYGKKEITTTIDYSEYYEKKKEAMWQHQSQLKDVLNILKSLTNRPKEDYFILGQSRDVKVKLPENDLFAGINLD